MNKRKIIYASLLLIYGCSLVYAQSDAGIIRQIYDLQLTGSPVYENLRHLTKNIGNRISGSENLEAAIEYSRKLLSEYGCDTVYLQPVIVPNWKRGEKEVLRIIDTPARINRDLNCLALGNSIATGAGGISGEVIEIHGLETLKQAHPEQVKGKIVFLNQCMDPAYINTFNAYAAASDQRNYAALEASKKGAIAVIVRSLCIDHDDFPHTGYTEYHEDVRKIPAVALSTNDSDLLSEQLKAEPNTRLYLELHCQTGEKVRSHNVIGEIKGAVYPDEMIAVGGHIDSWDVGEGVQDDGGACMQAIEVIRTFRELGIQPRRSIRVVLWTDEENGWGGNIEYARVSRSKNERHIAALEADNGVFTPLGFYFNTENKEGRDRLIAWKPLFEPYQLTLFKEGHTGADIEQLKDSTIVLLGLKTDSQRYFSLHHSEKDVFESVNKRELELGAAAMASMVYLIDKYGFP
jgi:carboxypeptidase Q